ncbi:MAG: c-type cytochrome [Filomicrobium sp.]
MSIRIILPVITTTLFIVGSLAPPSMAASRWVPLPVSKSEALSGRILTGDPTRGAELYAQCQACHQTKAENGHQIGPNLAGILKRPAAAHKKYNYSPALRQAGKEGLVWTHDFLDEYLEAPTKFMPDGAMAFIGVKDANDREDIIAYLGSLEAPEDAPWLLANLGKVDIPLPEQKPAVP